MDNKQAIWEEEIDVRYAETDQLGTVHHSQILVYFEVARASLFKVFTESYAALERRGIFAPVLTYAVDIVKPIYYEDKIIIRVKPYDYSGVRLSLAYEIFRKGEKEVLASGTTTNIFVDEEMKPINIRGRYPEIYEKLQNIFPHLDSSSKTFNLDPLSD